jgi:hypothetical protein
MHPIRDDENRYTKSAGIRVNMKYVLAPMLFFGLYFSAMANAIDYDETIESSNILLSLHTDGHSKEELRGLATLYVSQTLKPSDTNVCDSGLWINPKSNAAAFSVLLAGLISKAKIRFIYTANPIPLGSPNYCEIISVIIK